MQIFLKTFVAACFGMACLAPAQAHDFWLQPRQFTLPEPAIVPFTAEIGHGTDRSSWSFPPERVVTFKAQGVQGAQDYIKTLRLQNKTQLVNLSQMPKGSYFLVLETNHVLSDLPAARFNAYVEEEGITPILQVRQAEKKMDEPGREIYSRRAKALINLGRDPKIPQPHVTKPLGLSLEIVPQVDPITIKDNGALPVQVYWQGKALSGALVKLINLEADDKPIALQRTDQAGRTVFTIPKAGQWLLNVVWSKPIKGDERGDFDTTFSSLSFAINP
jgi:uncharacterized GH25 family protein